MKMGYVFDLRLKDY